MKNVLGGATKLKLTFLILLFVTVISGIVKYNHALASSFEGFYNFIGLENTEGLAFVDVSFTKKREDNKYIIEVTGQIANESHYVLEVPPVKVQTVSRGGKIMDTMYLPLPDPVIRPGKKIPFRPQISNISGNVDRIILDIGNKWELSTR